MEGKEPLALSGSGERKRKKVKEGGGSTATSSRPRRRRAPATAGDGSREQSRSTAGGAGQGQAQQGGGFKMQWGTLIRMMFALFVLQFALGGIGNMTGRNRGGLPPPGSHVVMWPSGTQLDIYAFVSESELPKSTLEDADGLLFKIEGYRFEPTKASKQELNRTVTFSESVQNNGTLYLHFYVVPAGWVAPAGVPPHTVNTTVYASKPLTIFKPVGKIDTRKNLISGETVLDESELEELMSLSGRWVSYWCPAISAQLVVDSKLYQALPEDLKPWYKLNDDGSLKPILYFNEFWHLNSWCTRINSTSPSGKLTFDLSVVKLWKFRLYANMEASTNMQKQLGTAGTEAEADEMKRMLIETNPILLIVTVLVTILHTVFDFLAFKNEIKFWKNNKSLEGLSVRTLFLNAITSVIIFLYLLDNETSWMVVISAGIACVIDAWKITKGVNVSVTWEGTLPRVHFEDKESYAGNKTKEYDAQAMRYLGYALYPLLAIYAAYSLMTQNHKNWYSWVLGSATGFVYTFGFIRMCPQLFINYKLKSVAAMPWRAFTYKTLSTFIDDLFAFIVKMPMMHRLACFRDDIVFFIYVYQRWIYPVDKKRVNEFGQIGEDPETQQAEELPGTQQAEPAEPDLDATS